MAARVEDDGFTVQFESLHEHLPKGHSGRAEVQFGEHSVTFYIPGVETYEQACALAMETLLQMARRGVNQVTASAKPGEKIKLV
jgi:hypothetical protein